MPLQSTQQKPLYSLPQVMLVLPSQVTVLCVSRTRQNFTVDFSKLLHSLTKGQYLSGAHKRAIRVDREGRNAG